MYDFGQLNMKTETEYIREIVSNHVRELAIDCKLFDTCMYIYTFHSALKVPLEARLSSHAFIDSVSRVLMFSQSYMKNREVCVFTTLIIMMFMPLPTTINIRMSVVLLVFGM